MMWMDRRQETLNDSDSDSISSGEEVPIWVRGEQRWVSGVAVGTTCQDLINVLLQDESSRGKPIGNPEQYHITERWRGVEQPLDPTAAILDIWNAWGTAQPEVRISLRRIKPDRMSSRRKRCRSDSGSWSDRSALNTVHPRRLRALAADRDPGGTEGLLKLVLAQGEVIKRQLRKLRYSENQIGVLEDKTHRARVRKHGSNYLLETYLKGLPEAVDPEECTAVDKNSDSGVVTEGDSEQSNPKPSSTNHQDPFERLSPSSEEFKEIKDDDSVVSETSLKDQVDIWEKVIKLNKRLLREEECLVRLHSNMRKYDKARTNTDDMHKSLATIRTQMAKSACEMQHNEIVLEETQEKLDSRRVLLDNLHKELGDVDEEFEMLQALLYSKEIKKSADEFYANVVNSNQAAAAAAAAAAASVISYPKYTKELNTLV